MTNGGLVVKALVKLGYGAQFLLPFDDAVVLIRTLEKAEGYKKHYDGGKEELYVLPNHVEITLDCLTDDQYAIAKMRGEVPEPNF
jgi:hypothetical protein